MDPTLDMDRSTTGAAVFYVEVNSRNPAPPYTSWASATTNIQGAADAARPHTYAQDARENQTGCIKINAIQVGLSGWTLDPYATPVMLDYPQTTCGWYSVVPHEGIGIVEAVLRMFYESGVCSCP